MTGPRPASSRLAWASLALGLFVLLDIALFGWLLFRSLSQREIERVLLETRMEAEGVAEHIVGRANEVGDDLYRAVALERETQTFIDSVLTQRDVVQTVEVRDLDGKLVFRGDTQATFPLSDDPVLSLEPREVRPEIERRTVEREATYDLEVPIGEMGFLQIGISQGELESRIEVLQGELVAKTGLAASLTIVLFVLGYLLVWSLWRRGRRLEEQARDAERMAYIGTLASGLAHEIRNPLNALNLNMQLLEEEIEAAGRAGGSQRLFSITRDEIDRLERLVTDFLSYAKPRPLEVENVEAIELLTRCKEVLASELAAHDAKLEIVDYAEGAQIQVDPGQINQLLLNLVQNGFQATERAGRPPEVTLTASRHAHEVVLEVEDRGVGMSAEDRERMFDLFFSTRRGGTGLGLAVVQRVTQAHGARIEVDSEPGAGTTVRLMLPAVEDRLASSAAQPTLEPSTG